MSRAASAIPPEMEDPDGDSPSAGGVRSGEHRFDRQRNPARRPASTIVRVFLLLAALVVLGGLGASAWLLKTYIALDNRFRIAGSGNIEATGLTEVSRAQMLPVFGEDIGRNVFFVPLNQRRKQLEEIPWIEKATVMRLLPDQIRVSVVERQPVAFVRSGSQVGLVDANGVLLAMPAAMMAQHHYSFPVVTGIDAQDAPGARKARMAVYQRLLAELDSNGQHISEQISEIDLTDPDDAQVLMPEQGADILAHFGEDRFLERYKTYKAGINQWRQQHPNLVAVDLRYDRQVVLSMPPGANVAQAAADEQNASSAANPSPSDGQVAESGQAAGESAEKQTSGAKTLGDPSGSAAKAHPGKPGAKLPAGQKKAAARKNAKALKTAAAKARMAQVNKKRAELNRAALNLTRQKAAPTNRPAPSAGLGQ